jgi:hypothetical protein
MEISPGGSRIYEHKEPKDEGLRVPEKYCVFMKEICARFDEMFPGRESFVFHEILSDLVHIDVHILAPAEKSAEPSESAEDNADEDFYVIYTTGMSDRPMNTPKEMPGAERPVLAELFMLLPSTWEPEKALDTVGNIPNENFWPISLIKSLARIPHDYKTWLGHGHTIPNGPHYEPFLEGSNMGGVVIVSMDGNFSPIVTEEGHEINLYTVMPISKEETEFKLEFGMDALMGLFNKFSVPVVVDILRESCV